MASRSRIQDSNTLEYFDFCAVDAKEKNYDIMKLSLDEVNYFLIRFLFRKLFTETSQIRSNLTRQSPSKY